jgi:Type IV secretion-system coupling protein DNA-binding domain
LNDNKSSYSFWDLFAKSEPVEEAPAEKGGSILDLLFPKKERASNSSQEPPPNCAEDFDEDFVFWAMRNLPASEATKNFLVCGTVGSGKSVAIELFLKSIAPRFRTGRPNPEQLIIFDAKSNTVPMLASLGLRPEDENFYILNPLDSRSAVWNIASAVQTPTMATAFAHLLIPEERNSTAPYFNDNARIVVEAVINALNAIHRDQWTLRDLLVALGKRKRIEAITGQYRPSADAVEELLGDKRNSPGVLSTIASKIGKYSAVAALWSANTTGRTFDIATFLDKPGVLVLGNSPALKESFWPLNAILLKALTEEILSRPDSLPPRHWFVLDEFRAMQKVECMHEFVNQGRSKGAAVLLGIQSVEGLVDVYKEQKANEILGDCAHKMFLRAGEHKTAEWAERHFNKVRQQEITFSYSTGSGTTTTTVQHSLQERSMFLASVFLNLAFPVRGGVYEAICDLPSMRETVILQRSFDVVLGWLPKPELTPFLSAQSLLNDVAIATRLKDQGSNLSAYLWGRLRETTRAGLTGWNENKPIAPGLKQALVEDLNGVLEGDSIWDGARFAGVHPGPETVQLIHSNPVGEDRSRLNRMLLQDAYPREISSKWNLKVIAVDLVTDVKKQTLWPWHPTEELKFCPPPEAKPDPEPPRTSMRSAGSSKSTEPSTSSSTSAEDPPLPERRGRRRHK